MTFETPDKETKFPSLRELDVTQSDLDRHSDGSESREHLWPKLIATKLFPHLSHRQIVTETFLGDCKHDIIVESPPEIRYTDTAWTTLGTVIEVVAHSDQDFLRKTKSALRHSHSICWIFLADCCYEDNVHGDYVDDARDELQPHALAPLRFGQFNPWDGQLQLGNDIQFSNFEYTINDDGEFEREFNTSCVRADGFSLTKGSNGFNLGEITINGERKRVFADGSGELLGLHDPSKRLEPREVSKDRSTKKNLKSLVETHDVERVGPVAGYRRERFESGNPVTDPYCFPQRFSSVFHHPHTLPYRA